MNKPSIPSVQPVQDKVVAAILAPLKENIESITGIRGGFLEKLPSNADLGAVVDKINEIIGRLNARNQ